MWRLWAFWLGRAFCSALASSSRAASATARTRVASRAAEGLERSRKARLVYGYYSAEAEERRQVRLYTRALKALIREAGL
jgi:hypothetical protein